MAATSPDDVPPARRRAENLRASILFWAVLVGTYSLIVGGTKYLGGDIPYEAGTLGWYAAAFAYATAIINYFILYSCIKDDTEYTKRVLPKARNFYVMCTVTSMFLVGSFASWNKPSIPGWDTPRLIGCVVHLCLIHKLVNLLSGEYAYRELQSLSPPPSPPADIANSRSFGFQNTVDTNRIRENEEDLTQHGRNDRGPIVISNYPAPLHKSHRIFQSSTSGTPGSSEA